MTFISLVPPVYYNVKQFGAVGDGVTDDTSAIQAAIAALPSCDVYDGSNNLITGKAGTIFFPSGVYKISALLTIPAGCITIQGSGMSSWIPIMSQKPFENMGGTAIVTTDYTDGLMTLTKDAFNNPVTALFLRDIDLRTVSPASPQTQSTPPVLNLNGWLTGEVSNVNVLEISASGGIGTNLHRVIDCSPGSARDTSSLFNVRAFGGNIAMTIAGAHITAIGITSGYTSTSIVSWANALDIQQDLGCFFANLHVFSSTHGLSLATGGFYQPMILYGVMFESCTHYIRQDFGGDAGVVIIENPCWNSSPDPLTDIPAVITSLNIITKYEQDLTGTNAIKHITVAKSSQTAGASPYTLTLQPYDRVVVTTTVGGMTALTLDGQALFNGSFTVGQNIYVGAGHTLIATWATTAPVFELLPL